MKRITLSFLTLFILVSMFLVVVGKVGALSVAYSPWFTWTVEFDESSFPEGLTVDRYPLKSGSNIYWDMSGEVMINNKSSIPIYFLSGNELPVANSEIPFVGYPAYKLVDNNLYQYNAESGYSLITDKYPGLRLNSNALYGLYHFENFNFENKTGDNRPNDVELPQPVEFVITAYYQGKVLKLPGKIVYALNDRYVSDSVERGQEAAEEWGNQQKLISFTNNRGLLRVLFGIVIFLLAFNVLRLKWRKAKFKKRK